MTMFMHILTKHNMLVIQEVALCTGNEKLTPVGVLPAVGLLVATTPNYLISA